jgi:hypothetical protein
VCADVPVTRHHATLSDGQRFLHTRLRSMPMALTIFRQFGIGFVQLFAISSTVITFSFRFFCVLRLRRIVGNSITNHCNIFSNPYATD